MTNDIKTKHYRLQIMGFHPAYDDMPPFLEQEEKNGFFEWWADNEYVSSKTLAIAWAASEINQLEGVLEAHLLRIDIRQTVVDKEVYEEENENEVWHKYYPQTEKRLKHLFPQNTL